MKDPITGHEIELTPVQTRVEGLTQEESAAAYKAVAERFKLRGPQRSQLDRSHLYTAILKAAHRSEWRIVERWLGHAHIIE